MCTPFGPSFKMPHCHPNACRLYIKMSPSVTLVAAFALALASISIAAAAGFDKDTPSAAADRITSLPGLNPFPTDYAMYSGYVTVNAASQRRLFYWMVTSKADSANAPLVMWLNGGPGCR